MRLPTVRVTHPILGAVTINAADFGEQHELHAVQAEDFDPAHLARPVAPLGLDPAVRDLAAEIMVGLTTVRLSMVDQTWGALTGPEQLAALRDAEADVGDLLAIRQVRRHKPYAPDPAMTDAALATAKGPRGLWYVVRSEERVSKGFREEAEANAERLRMNGDVA